MSRAPRRSLLVPVTSFAFVLVVAAPMGAITVTSLADSGAGTLREAIGFANSDGIPTSIDFAAGLAGGVISPLSQLPDLTENGTTIDGDLGADCDPDIAIDGGAAGPGAYGLALRSDGHAIRGIAIYGFDNDGLQVWGSGIVVECSYFGTDLALAAGRYNGQHAINHFAGNGNRIGPGNIVVSNGDALWLTEPTADGYPLFASLTPDDVRRYPWGGPNPFLDDFLFPEQCIWRSSDESIPTDGGGAPFSENFGVRLTGQLDLGAGGDYTFTTLPYDFRRLLVDGVVVIDYTGTEPNSAVVSGLSAGPHALEIDVRKGGGAAGINLVVAGPGSVSLTTGGAPPAGCGADLPGLCGELFRLRVPSERNTITQSSIHDDGSGAGNPISLSAHCVRLVNDPGDLDVGANTGLNHPEISSLVYGGTPGTYTVSGTAPPDSTVELFGSYGAPGGFGQGETYLASTVASPGGSFSTSLSLAPGTTVLTATATDPAGNTSEFAPNFAPAGGQDGATVSSAASAWPGQAFAVPVYARDVSLTPLGIDRPAGEKIQSLSYKVTFTPATSIASKLFARAGITAGLTPIFQSTPTTATTASYLGTFDEVTNPIPFTLDAAAPGNQVLQINVTLATASPAGTIALTLDPAATLLANQAGSIEETPANGWLALADGWITVLSNAAAGLYAAATSSSAIQLTWADPNANETGFRLERSTDAANWSPVTTLGANATSYLDATGLSPATLYYYRLVTLVPADSQVSNFAAASTFAAVAAKVCATRVSAPRYWARNPSVAWDGTAWGVAWQAREDGFEDDVWFQRFAATTLAPIGSPVRVSTTGADSSVTALRWGLPALAWNGTRYGLIWNEFLPGEPGIPATYTTFFALLDQAGNKLRGDVRVPTARTQHPYESGQPPELAWDGTHWGIFAIETAAAPLPDIVYRRLDDDGDQVLGPITVVAPATASVSDVVAAWNAPASRYGIAWFEIQGTTNALYFQRMEETTGALVGSPVAVASYESVYGTYGFSLVADASGWALTWSSSEPVDDSSTFLARFDSGGNLIGPPTPVSDPDELAEGNPLLVRKPGGGFADFVSCFRTYGYEICRLETDAGGNRIGGLTVLTPDDVHPALSHDVAANSTDSFLAWNDQTNGSLELGGLLAPLADGSPPGPVEPLTSGHGPGNNAGTPGPGSMSVFPLGAGFGAVWTDPVSGNNLIQAHTWDGTGATIAELSPLTAMPSRGRIAATAVGGEFAVAWRDVTTTDLWFARFDSDGSPIAGPVSVSTLGTSTQIALAFSGEHYGLAWPRGGGMNFLRVTPDGTPVGGDLFVPLSMGAARIQMAWVGTGWATAWTSGDEQLHYSLIAADGTSLVADVALGRQVEVVNPFHLLWTGQYLALAWSERPGYADPPLEDLYFMRLNLDGSVAVPPEVVASGPGSDRAPILYWAGGTFHLLHTLWGTAGAREVEIQPDGTVVPGSRFWDHRGAPASAAFNGATLGLGLFADYNLFFETGACLADATPPPCPALEAASLDDKVHLSWPAVSDPQSGILEYHVYRDSLALADVPAPGTTFDDGGYVIGTTHVYQVRALNGAFDESDACPTLSFSTTAGDANGNGALDVADIFYLINFFFADGPPPLGDADANGDGGVTVTDIFFLINYFFSGGPHPAWIGAESREVPGGAR